MTEHMRADDDNPYQEGTGTTARILAGYGKPGHANIDGSVTDGSVPGWLAAQVATLLPAARAWIADCEWADDTTNLTDAQVVRGIQRHYSGGWAQFARDAGQ